MALAAIGCGDEDTTSTTIETTTSSGPPIGSTAWGADECLYTYVGNEQYDPAELCRRQQSDGSVAYFNRSEPTRITFVESGGSSITPTKACRRASRAARTP